MYTGDRAKWWIARSRSPEYQKAYDRIASRIPASADIVLFDAACGPGEMLKRAYKAFPDRFIVGSDASHLMLSSACENLQSASVPARIYKSAAEMEIRKGEVSLVYDNIVESRIPENFSDVTLFTFPDYGIDYPATDSARHLMKKFLQNGGRPEPGEIKDCMFSLCVQNNLARATKRGGTLIVVRYGASQGIISDYDKWYSKNERGMAIFGGLDMTGNAFFESIGIYGDTCEAQTIRNPQDMSVGYRIIKMAKP